MMRLVDEDGNYVELSDREMDTLRTALDIWARLYMADSHYAYLQELVNKLT